MDNWIFGCDICQTVCPWNRFSTKHQEPKFDASAQLQEMEQQDWEEITAEVFNLLFKKSAVKRTKFTACNVILNLLNPIQKHKKRRKFPISALHIICNCLFSSSE